MQKCRTTLLVAVGLVLVSGGCASGQTSNAATEAWPAVRATFEIEPRLGVQVFYEKHDGEDVSRSQWKVGTMFSYRMKRMLQRHRDDIEHENLYNLVVGAGYEFVQTKQSNGTKREHRLMLQTTPKYTPGGKVLLQDRNRVEFRWVDGVYDFRYRNKLTVDRPLKVNQLRFTAYASGELFWDRNHHEWNENRYAFGVQVPYKKLLMLDSYYLRKNCTTCTPDPVSVFGISLSLYFKRR